MGKEDKQDRPWGIIVGGQTLTKHGEIATITGAVCVYENMKYAHVQQFWNWAKNNPKFIEAQLAYMKAVMDELIKFGDQWGIATKQMEKDELVELPAEK